MQRRGSRKGQDTQISTRQVRGGETGTTSQELPRIRFARPGTKAPSLISPARTNSLIAWFELYLATEAPPPDTNTFKAKRRDLEEWLSYFTLATGTDHPDQWTKSLTEGFLKHLLTNRKLAATTVNRVLATLKHVSVWLDRRRPFLAGKPCERVRDITTDEANWRGLEDLQVNRLKSAAEQLCHINTRADQNPVRDQAILLVLLHTALRVSELLALDLAQYDGKYLVNIRRKGKAVTRELLIAKPARDALDRYLDQVRGRAPGPLFQSRTGEKLAPQNVDTALKKIAAQANATLAKVEQIHLSAHMLRHTMLRKAAEKEDIRYAMRLSGHTSSKYIWRYTEPSRQDQEQALEDLF
jgi:integrase/recombinase XerD